MYFMYNQFTKWVKGKVKLYKYDEVYKFQNEIDSKGYKGYTKQDIIKYINKVVN